MHIHTAYVQCFPSPLTTYLHPHTLLILHSINKFKIVMEWESVVNRVAKCELGEKMIVCGRAARWWDEQIKDKINARCQVYKKVVNGREDLWGEYCRLRKEVKQLVIEKKLNIWNELVEKVNTDFDENRKEFWAFVGRKSKGKKKNIASLKSDTGLSLTSTRGK